jgi:hypothetical protein
MAGNLKRQSLISIFKMWRSGWRGSKIILSYSASLTDIESSRLNGRMNRC